MSLVGPLKRQNRKLKKERSALLFLVVGLASAQLIRVGIANESPTFASIKQRPLQKESIFFPSKKARARLKSQDDMNIIDPKTWIPQIRLHSIFDQGAVEAILRAVTTQGGSPEIFLENALSANDHVLSIGLALAIRNSTTELSERFQSHLLANLSSTNRSIVENSIEVVGLLPKAGEELRERLRELAFDSRARIRYRAISALRRLQDGSTDTMLLTFAALRDSSEYVAMNAAKTIPAVGPWGTSRSPYKLISLSRKTEKQDESNLLRKLNALTSSSEDTHETLLASLGSDFSEVRAKAAMRVTELSDFRPDIIAALSRLQSDSDARVRFAAGFALGKSGAAGISATLESCRHEDPNIRLSAVQTLSAFSLDLPQVRAGIEEMFEREGDARVQFQLALLMLEIHPDSLRAQEILIEELPFVQPEVKQRIISKLKAADRATVITNLQEASTSGNAFLQTEATALLEQIQPQS